MATLTTSRRRNARQSPAPADCPWAPNQVFAVGMLFGGLAAGVIAAMNAKRLGRPQWAVPSVIAGVLAVVVGVITSCLLPEQAGRGAALFGSLVIGGLLSLVQRGAYKAWKAENDPGSSVKAPRVWQIVGVGVLCLAVQIGLTLAGYVTVHGADGLFD